MAPTAMPPTPEHSAGTITGEPVIPSPTTGGSSAVSFPIFAGQPAASGQAQPNHERREPVITKSSRRHSAQVAGGDAPVRLGGLAGACPFKERVADDIRRDG
jgi:hypothetical protein